MCFGLPSRTTIWLPTSRYGIMSATSSRCGLMYMPLTMASMRLPSRAGINPLNSIEAMLDCRFIFLAQRIDQVDVESGRLVVLLELERRECDGGSPGQLAGFRQLRRLGKAEHRKQGEADRQGKTTHDEVSPEVCCQFASNPRAMTGCRNSLSRDSGGGLGRGRPQSPPPPSTSVAIDKPPSRTARWPHALQHLHEGTKVWPGRGWAMPHALNARHTVSPGPRRFGRGLFHIHRLLRTGRVRNTGAGHGPLIEHPACRDLAAADHAIR